MDTVAEILRSLWNTSLSYKGVRVNLFGIPQFKNKSDGSLRSTLSYMRGKGLIQNYNRCWQITPRGRKYVQKKFDSLAQFPNIFPKDAPKNLIVMFDVPESQKAEREWLRWHLKKFNYAMIQKSVWVGPSPLTEEFVKYIEKIKLKSAIKTFKLAKSYPSK